LMRGVIHGLLCCSTSERRATTSFHGMLSDQLLADKNTWLAPVPESARTNSGVHAHRRPQQCLREEV
jgi:hypothetical protein